MYIILRGLEQMPFISLIVFGIQVKHKVKLKGIRTMKKADLFN